MTDETDETHFMSQSECFSFLVTLAERNPTVFQLRETDLIYKVVKSLEGSLKIYSGETELTEELCKTVLLQAMHKIQSKVGFDLITSSLVISVQEYFMKPENKVPRFAYKTWMDQDSVIVINKLRAEKDDLKERLGKLEERMEMVWFAPGMPGFETGEKSFNHRVEVEETTMQTCGN